ncbi:FAD-dependent oxidoreductase [Rossellomorea arthrocnemi]|uniref:FAD-dependent oxidoreductase n=1 Tax=Rossellomorea arthrocnemi TaxID=2769542 RepID=UPI00191B52CF|nr:FAD-dependent oxidoreductase [Rossellomorea arthrocnemi]
MKTIILVGGGHSHLHCLKKIPPERENVKWVLISPSRYQYYSGMFSGYTEGIYSLEETRIDLESLCEGSGCDFIESTVLSIDPDQQHLLTEKGDIFTYDFVSFDIGSRNDSMEIEGLHTHNLPIKPNYRFPEQIEKLYNSRKTVFIGGGAASIEMALSLKAWKMDKGCGEHSITVVHSSPLLEKAGSFSSKKMREVALSKGIDLHQGRVKKVNGTHVHTDKGEILGYDEVILLGGPKAPQLFGSSVLPNDEEGFLMVNSYLQSVAYPNVFGTGDCATLQDFPNTPKNGVTAISQGPVLWRNLTGAATGGKIIPFEPQKRYLAIMSLGNKRGFLTYGSFSLVSGWAWRLKNWIDVRFVGKYGE